MSSAPRDYHFHEEKGETLQNSEQTPAEQHSDWDNVWKRLGGIMVNGVPGEVPRPNPEGPQAPRVLAVGLPEGLHSP